MSHLAVSCDVNKFSHMVFLVLDHNQPNPLFRAPIADSPKVKLYRSDYRLNVPLIPQYRISWTSELVKGVGQCNSESNPSQKNL
jgi:hypothetical protein